MPTTAVTSGSLSAMTPYGLFPAPPDPESSAAMADGGNRDSLQADHITKPPHGAEWPASGLGRAALPEPVNENLALGVG